MVMDFDDVYGDFNGDIYEFIYIYVWFIKDQTGFSDSMDDFYGF
jgi:hypothetical protein